MKALKERSVQAIISNGKETWYELEALDHDNGFGLYVNGTFVSPTFYSVTELFKAGAKVVSLDVVPLVEIEDHRIKTYLSNKR